jgi:hypothetical protein
MMLSVILQALAQWSGANSITIYAPRYFAMVSTTGQSERLFATAIFGIDKFVSAIIYGVILTDLYIGISLHFISKLDMGLFLVID